MKMIRLVKVVVMVVLVVVLARLVEFDALVESVRAADPGLLLVAVGAAFVDRLVMIGKWYPLLRVQLPSIPLLRAARAYIAAGFAALVLPTSVGGDMLRAIALGRGRGAVMEVGASIVTERLLGMAALGVPTCLALLVAWHRSVSLGILLPWAFASLAGSIVALLLLSSARAVAGLRRVLRLGRAGKWTRLVDRFAIAYAAYSRYPSLLIGVGLVSVLEQGFPILVYWIVSLALGAPISLEMLVVAIPLRMFVARLPISIAGIGVAEGAVVYILGLYGVSPVDALALALTARVPELAGLLPGLPLWYDLVGTSKDDVSPTNTAADGTPTVAIASPVPAELAADGSPTVAAAPHHD
jgi:uncharacterized protein (TIRG00374 family)